QDKKLKRSFSYIYDHGTEQISAATVQRCLTSREIKLEPKQANVGGLQLVEIIGHPSHQAMCAKFTGFPMTAKFDLKGCGYPVESEIRPEPNNKDYQGMGPKMPPLKSSGSLSSSPSRAKHPLPPTDIDRWIEHRISDSVVKINALRKSL